MSTTTQTELCNALHNDETVIHPLWCDRDCGDGQHWHWIMRENWQVQAVLDTNQEPPLPGVYVGLTNSDAQVCNPAHLLLTSRTCNPTTPATSQTRSWQPWRR